MTKTIFLSIFLLIMLVSVLATPAIANAQYYYNYNNNCTYHAYKDCSGGSVYWYDGCQVRQDMYQNCINGQICQNAQCVYIQPIAQSNYIAYYKTACYGNSIRWFDSLGAESGLYKSCQDNNACTLDACSTDKCSNTLKCDGSTCATGSADYNKYCLPVQPTATPQPSPTPTVTPTPSPTVAPAASVNGLSTSFFAKENPSSGQWQKTAQIGSNGKVYFMVDAMNNSTTQIDNVNVSVNIPTEISSLGNLQLNGVLISGDIVSGINIGSVAPMSTKSITFEGKTQTLSNQETKQASATTNVSGAVQSDSISINFTATQPTPTAPAQVAAAVSSTPSSPGFMDFLKRWYLWILAGLVLIFLFVAVFKRFSSEI